MSTDMDPEAEDWVLNVYAKGIGCIAETLRCAGVNEPDRWAGIVLAELAHLDPPLVLERVK